MTGLDIALTIGLILICVGLGVTAIRGDTVWSVAALICGTVIVSVVIVMTPPMPTVSMDDITIVDLNNGTASVPARR